MSAAGLYGLVERVGRRRRPEPATTVTVVVDGREVVLPADSAIARAMSQVATLLAHW